MDRIDAKCCFVNTLGKLLRIGAIEAFIDRTVADYFLIEWFIVGTNFPT
jgi:hypothetical protein